MLPCGTVILGALYVVARAAGVVIGLLGSPRIAALLVQIRRELVESSSLRDQAALELVNPLRQCR